MLIPEPDINNAEELETWDTQLDLPEVTPVD